MIYVLYHANCIDGLGAKLAAWEKFHNEATYLAVNYDQPVPDLPDGSEVYILDFSYPRAILERMNSEASKLVVLDHHKTAQEDLVGLPYAHFDMGKSGAVMAWGYFHPNEPVPLLLKHIQDRDLWKFEMPATRAVHAGILAALKRGKGRDDVSVLDMHLRYAAQLADDGAAILKYQDSLINQILDQQHYLARTYSLEMGNYRIAVVNQIPSLSSDTGSRLLEETSGADYCILYTVGSTGDVYLSLRSKGKNDCTVLAQALARQFGWGGGGGHKNASGCKVRLSWLLDVYRFKEEERIFLEAKV